MKSIFVGTLALVLAAGAQSNEAERQLRAAMNAELVNGDLKAAIRQYGDIAVKYKNDRAVAAKALVKMAEAYQKMGDTEANRIYERVLREFADQKAAVTEARARLRSLSAYSSTQLTTRRVWVPPSYNMRGGSLSADGRFFSYAEFFTGGDLAVRDLVTGQTRRLTNKGSFLESPEYASTSVISPDQKRIAFTWKGKERWELRMIDWGGSNQQTVYAHPEGTWLEPIAWSPDGREILLHLETRDRTKQIAWIPAGGGRARVLKTFPWQTLDDVKALSPDGRHIAYDAAGADGKSRTIFVLASDGSSETAVTGGSTMDMVVGWMPDGKTLLFATDRTGVHELWAVPVYSGKRSGEAFMVKADFGQVNTFGISKDGTLLYSRYMGAGHVYTASLDWASNKVVDTVAISRGIVPHSGADWSSDGRKVAFVGHRGSVQSERFIVVHSLDTGENREVRPEQMHVQAGVSWSPNSRSYMIAGADRNGRTGIYEVDIETGEAHALIRRDGNVQYPQWLPGGKEILYVPREPVLNRSQVFIRNVETGTDREISFGTSTSERINVKISPDGRYFAWTPWDNNRYHTVYVAPVSGGAPRQIYEAGAGRGVLIEGWSKDSQRVVLAYSKQNGPKLEWVPAWVSVDGGAVHEIQTSLERFRFHPDGRRIVGIKGDLALEFSLLQNLPAALQSAGER